MKNEPKAYIFAGLTILCWSTVATAFKFGLRYQGPFSLLAGAALVTFIILLITLLTQGKLPLLRQMNGAEIAYSAALGLLNPFFYYLVLFKAYNMLPAQVAQPINMIWPIVLTVISIPLLKQKISLKSILALFISFGGVILISSQGWGRDSAAPRYPAYFSAWGVP